MTDKQPRLSVVVVSRNDDHGGNLMQRMQMFVSGWLEQAKRHNINSELIIVEWNPLPDRPKLAKVLLWPEDTGPCTVRVIEVPPEIHRRFKYADSLPVFQMLGKNAGIRRARGKYILATNIDILFSSELARFLGSGKLKPKYMYRIDRYDVPADVPADAPIDKQLDYCRKNVIRINGRDGTLIISNITESHLKKSLKLFKERFLWLTSVRNRFDEWFISGKPLHCNACGDFTLLSRERWMAMRGYAEFEMYSMHLDGLLCTAANQSGAREKILKDPMRIYHIEHAAGSGYQPGKGWKMMEERLKSTGIPKLSFEQFTAWETEMRKTRRPMIFNQNENWGLADEQLPETVITG